MFVVDASVWVSSFLPSDTNHETAAMWIDQAFDRRIPIYAPAVLLPEVAGSVARVTGDTRAGVDSVHHLLHVNRVVLVPQNADSYASAAELASRLRLRGCDALYVQVATELGLTLVSFDEQQIARSLPVVQSGRPFGVGVS